MNGKICICDFQIAFCISVMVMVMMDGYDYNDHTWQRRAGVRSAPPPSPLVPHPSPTAELKRSKLYFFAELTQSKLYCFCKIKTIKIILFLPVILPGSFYPAQKGLRLQRCGLAQYSPGRTFLNHLFNIIVIIIQTNIISTK